MSIIIKSEEGLTLECLHNVNQKLAVCIEEEGTYPLVFEFDNEKDVDFFIEELRKAKLSVFNKEQTKNLKEGNEYIDLKSMNKKYGFSNKLLRGLYEGTLMVDNLYKIKESTDLIIELSKQHRIGRKTLIELQQYLKIEGIIHVFIAETQHEYQILKNQ